MKWYIRVLKKYATFSGRARRKEFWMFYLFHIIIIFAFLLVDAYLDTPTVFLDDIPSLLATIYILGTLLPYLSVTVRRLHDTDRSGWWILITIIPNINILFIPIINIVGTFVLLLFFLVQVIYIIGIIVLFVFLVQDSDAMNVRGPNPKVESG